MKNVVIQLKRKISATLTLIMVATMLPYNAVNVMAQEVVVDDVIADDVVEIDNVEAENTECPIEGLKVFEIVEGTDGKVELPYFFDAYTDDNGYIGDFISETSKINVEMQRENDGYIKFSFFNNSIIKYYVDSFCVDGNEVESNYINSQKYCIKESELVNKTIEYRIRKINRDQIGVALVEPDIPDSEKLDVYWMDDCWDASEYSKLDSMTPLSINSLSYAYFVLKKDRKPVNDYEVYVDGKVVKTWTKGSAAAGGENSTIYTYRVLDKDIEVSYKPKQNFDYTKFGITFDAGEGEFTKSGITREGSNVYSKSPDRKTLQYKYFSNGENKYGVNVRKWQNITPVCDGYIFGDWYEAKEEDGKLVPDLTKPYVYDYYDESEVRNVTYVANYVKELPKIDLKDITINPNSKGFTFDVNVNYDELKECYNPETEVLMFQFTYGAKNHELWNNDEAGADGYYTVWNGYDVMKKNGVQTLVAHDPTVPYIFEKPVTEDVTARVSVRYVVIRKDNPDTTPDRHFINGNHQDINRNILNEGTYSDSKVFTISPAVYRVSINNGSSNITYAIANDADKKYCKKTEGYEDTWSIGSADSNGIILTLTVKNSRVPLVVVNGKLVLITPEAKSTKTKGVYEYKYEIKENLNKDENAENIIVTNEMPVGHTVNVAIDDIRRVDVSDVRIGSLRQTKPLYVDGKYEFIVLDGETLTVTLEAKTNCTIDKLGTKKINKTTYEYAVTPKLTSEGEASTTSVSFTSTSKDIVTLKNDNGMIIPIDKKNNASVEYGVKYILAYENGNSNEDSRVGASIAESPSFKINGEEVTIDSKITGNALEFTIPHEYHSKKIVLDAKAGEKKYPITLNLTVKPAVTAIKSIAGTKKVNGVLTATQGVDTKVEYKLTAKEKSATMGDLKVSVSGNGIVADISDGVVTVQTKQIVGDEDKENKIEILDKDNNVVGVFAVNVVSPKVGFKLNKISATLTDINLTLTRDKSVVKPETANTKVLYKIKLSSPVGFLGATQNEESGLFTKEVEVPTNFDNKSDTITLKGLLSKLHDADAKFNVEVSMVIKADDEVLAETPAKKVQKKSVVLKALKVQNKPITFTKKVNKLTKYDDIELEYHVATVKWASGVNYKKLSSIVTVMPKAEGGKADGIIARADNDNVYVLLGSAATPGKYEIKVTPCDANDVEISNMSNVYAIEVVESPLQNISVTYPVTMLKQNNKAVSIKATAGKLPKGYKMKYTLSSNDLSGKKIKINEKSGVISVTKDYVLESERDSITVKAERLDAYGNTIDSTNRTVDLIAKSPKFGKFIAVEDVDGKYKAVRTGLGVGKDYKFIVLKYGALEKDEYSYEDALENVTITSSNKNVLAPSDANTARAIKADKKAVTITAIAGDGSKQKVKASFFVK